MVSKQLMGIKTELLFRWLASVLIVSVFSACSYITKSKLSHLTQVRAGQSPEEVKSVLGSPVEVQYEGNLLTWHYDLFSDNGADVYAYEARFNNRILISILPNSSRDSARKELKDKRANNKKSSPPVFMDMSTSRPPPLNNR